MNPYNELYRLNNLFEKYDCKMCEFNPFVLTEVRLIKDCYDSTFIFQSNRKYFFSVQVKMPRMKNIRFGRQICMYMNNIMDEEKARRLDSIRVARCFSLLLPETIEHNQIFSPRCFCFKCRLRCLLNF